MELPTSRLGEDLIAKEAKVPREYQPLRVKAVKQISNMLFIVEILKKARDINLSSSSSNEDATFNIDDFLVEMAVLKTNKRQYSDLVFYFKIKNDTHKWQIRRSYDQIRKLHKSIARFKRKSTVPELPHYEPEKEIMVHRLSKYLNQMIATFKDHEKDWMKIEMFLENTQLRGAEVDKITKTGWGAKGIGGRYKTNKFTRFFKNKMS